MSASMRGPLTLGAAALVALVAGFGLWATQATLSGAVVARGVVEGELARQTVQHPDGGEVAEVLVAEGALVAAGDALVRLDGAALRSDLRILDERLSDYAALTARLLAERDGAPGLVLPPGPAASGPKTGPETAAQIAGQARLFEARSAALAEARALLARRIDQIRAQAGGVAVQRGAVEAQLALVGEELASQQALRDRGLAAQASVLALRREAAGLQGRLGELTAMLARLGDQVSEVEIERGALLTRRRESAEAELRAIGPAILELAETRRALAARLDRLTLRAPVAGVVHDLRVTGPGAVLRAAEPVLTLVPQDSPVVIAARVDPREIDAVSLGQLADLRLTGLPPSQAPRLTGRVILISAAALTDAQTGAAYYLARLALDPESAARLGRPRILPGMPVEVYLRTESRTPLVYLLEPFTDYFSRALRES